MSTNTPPVAPPGSPQAIIDMMRALGEAIAAAARVTGLVSVMSSTERGFVLFVEAPAAPPPPPAPPAPPCTCLGNFNPACPVHGQPPAS